MGEPALLAEGLERRFGERPVLRGVHLRLEAGETLAVFGPNGAGKTTLLRVLATLLRPSAGTVRVLGCSLPGEGWRLRGRVGLVGHEPLLYRELTGRQNLRLCARLHGLDPAAAGRRIEELLAAVGMARRADEPVARLARGLAQRLAICRAVLHDPELLLLDEPRAHLDPEGAALAGPLIGAGPGRTRVLVSHDVRGALAEGDRALALGRGGAVAYQGPAAGFPAAEAAALYGGEAG